MCIPLFSSVNGRVAEKGIPSIISSVGIEESFFSYEAPIFQYVALDFGFVNTKGLNGFYFGGKMQWIDGKTVAGITDMKILFITSRDTKELLLGPELYADIQYGSEKQGMGLYFSGKSLLPTKGKNIYSIEVGPSTYLSPTEKITISPSVGVGHTFSDSNNFFINFSIKLEAYIWK